MKTRKSAEFVKHARGLPRARFAVVGSTSQWMIYEGTHFAEATASDGEKLIKCSCLKKQNALSVVAVGGTDEITFLKKVFAPQLKENDKSLTFKTISKKDGAELEKLVADLAGPLAGQIAQLPESQRDAVAQLSQQAEDLAADGNLSGATAKVAELKQRLATATPSKPVPPTGKPIVPPIRSTGRAQPRTIDPALPAARQEFNALLTKIEQAASGVEPEFVDKLQQLLTLGQAHRQKTVGDADPARTKEGHDDLKQQFVAILQQNAQKKADTLALAAARQKFNDLLADAEQLEAKVQPEFVSHVQRMLVTGKAFLQQTAADTDAARTEAAYDNLKERLTAILQRNAQTKAAAPQGGDTKALQMEVLTQLKSIQTSWPDAFKQLFEEYKQCLNEPDAVQRQQRLEAVRGRAAQVAQDEQVLNEVFSAKRPTTPKPDPQTLQQEIMATIESLMKLGTPTSLAAVKTLMDGLKECMTKPQSEQLGRLQALRIQAGIEQAREEEFKAMQDAGNEFGQLIPEIIGVLPAEAVEFKNRLGRVNTADDMIALLNELKRRVDLLKKEGPAKLKRAMEVANDPAALKAIGLEERIGHLTALRFGEADTLKDRQGAMGKIYKTMQLEKDFLKKDNDLRKRVLEQLKKDPVLVQASKDWNRPDKMEMEDKRKALQAALAAQCRKENMDIDPVPEIVFFTEAPNKVSDDEHRTLAGFFNPQDGKIYMNDRSETFDDFDGVLNTAMHENTHNYQHHLVAKLEADPPQLKPGDADYNQARLFQLNFKTPGYIKGSDGKGEEYKDQPVEMHAWKAGDEAGRVFVEDAQARVALFVLKIDKLLQDAKIAGVQPRRLIPLSNVKSTLERARDGEKTPEIEEALAEAQEGWEQLEPDISAAMGKAQ
jgi:hypothetical protein